VCLRINSDD